MADRDYHELGDADLRRRFQLGGKPADAKELPQPKGLDSKEVGGRFDVGVDPEQFDRALAEAGLVSVPVPGANVTFSQLPDGRMFFTVELPAGAYENLLLADRQALLDGVLADLRARLTTLWSLGA